jgi:hypothetical protein
VKAGCSFEAVGLLADVLEKVIQLFGEGVLFYYAFK